MIRGRALVWAPMRWFLVFVALALPARAQDRVVNIYNWTDYIDPSVLADFTKETGIQTRYDVFDSLETLEAKLLAGHSGYDIVVPSNEPTFSRLIRAGALATIDRTKVPNWKNLDPMLMQRVESSDKGNRHGAIYLWGSIGLGINPDRIRALAPDAPLDSWALLLDPAWAKRVAPCGIIMMDSAIDVIPSVLRYLGRSPDGSAPGDLDAVSTNTDGDSSLYPRVRQRWCIGSLGDRTGLPGAGLLRRCRSGGRSGDGSREGRRRNVRGAEGGCGDRFRYAGDPIRRAA